MWNPCGHKTNRKWSTSSSIWSLFVHTALEGEVRRAPPCTNARKLHYMEPCMHKTLKIARSWKLKHWIEACWAPGNYSILRPCIHHKTPGNYRIFEPLYAQHLQRLSPCMQAMEMTAFQALAYIASTKSFDLLHLEPLHTQNSWTSPEILANSGSFLAFVWFAERASCARKHAPQAEILNADCESHDPFHKRSQNRPFMGRPVKGTRQETSKLYILHSRAEKISYASAKFYTFGNSGPSRISSVCQTFRLDGKELWLEPGWLHLWMITLVHRNTARPEADSKVTRADQPQSDPKLT